MPVEDGGAWMKCGQGIRTITLFTEEGNSLPTLLPFDKHRLETVLDRGSSSDGPRYHLTMPILNFDLDL